MATRYPGVIPPHMLKRLSEHGSESQRRWASSTLSTDRHFRQPMAAREMAAALHAEYSNSPRGTPSRYIFDAGHKTELPGELVLSEGEPATADDTAHEAYTDLGATYRFFYDVFERHSIDGEGMALLGSVHYGEAYQNAFWDGRQMVFGDGDGEIFLPFTRAIDVVAHELTHGVTELTAGLVYYNQSGALNESISDVFGVMVKQYQAGQTVDEADWLIGAALLGPEVQGKALRSMAAPGTAYDDPVLGKDPQPGHMDQFVDTTDDNGGVHINSGIPNHAFYLIATELGGYSWETAGAIWYAALTDERLANDAQFVDFAGLTMAHATQRFGSKVADIVQKGWQQVGIGP
ncbi:M4 family metallopeptidase [Larsenimonas rhizosphaerae]|uniref:Neutral metalloproteinase n=1 Tax=Larsenimonas rhizosphaerae TaxID=2944682 RepID=A0AA42CUI1_9GAMM|nr:M4 family metallopeptidase [Larsenimonas rhizosphaerae]MCM2132104.1 M4 family metallopeptidase [Larsenimonas rhizosphaerae]MCX2524707.1 M4 family metallopeptidase [Larsenimonas rhizosphaerae]